MKNAVRQKSILRLLAGRNELSVDHLAQTLEISPATVRRCLQDMEGQGLLKRIHGGATLDGISGREPLFEDKQHLNPDAKRAIPRNQIAE